jgi:CubicO group peptidase (beta-lactamase class C family)
MPANRICHLRAMGKAQGRRSVRAAAAVIALVALNFVLVGCEAQPRAIVVDDFESGAITGWQAVGSGSGGWFVYSDGHKAPDPAQSDPNAPFAVPDPPQGRFAAVTDMNGPGTRILYRDLRLEGRLALQATVFYTGTGPFSSPATLAHDTPEANQQFRIDLVRPSAPIDSVAKGDVLVNVFHTSPGDPARRQPTEVSLDVSAWAGQGVRLRLATTDNQGPLRVGVDNIGFQRIGGADGRVERLATPRPSSAIDLVLHRMTQADAVAALSEHAKERARADEFAGAVLVARHGKVLLNDAWGRADRKAGVANTPATRFRIGSMNKMFTAVATLQLVEAHKLKLDDPIGKHLPGYPNKEVAAKVTVRHLLTHTGGTGDIFGPEFDQHRLQLREHRDYLQLYGSRGLTHEPGARFEYSNYGFVLLGALIERVTGGSYDDYVRDHVFRRAGMRSTGALPEAVEVPDRAVGYLRSSPAGGGWVPNTDTLPWRGTAAGGGYSTVGDLLRFAQALDSGRLISEATLAEATRPHQQRYGYGFDVQGQGRLGSYGHGGGAPGMNGELRVFPQLGYVLVSLSNLDPPAASELVEFFTLRMPDR